LDLSFLYGSTILPKCILIVCLIIILILDLISEERDTSSLYFISLMGLLISIGLLLFQWNEKPIISFSALCSLLCIPLSVEYIRRTKMPMTEFIIFVITATIGGMFLCGVNDLITIFVALECLSLCSYLLSGYTKKDVRSNEAIMKYLLMGGISSSILAYGFSWLYGLSGGDSAPRRAFIALICIIVGIGFKLSLVPFHQWTPDVYEGESNKKDLVFCTNQVLLLRSFVAFLSVAPKVAGLALVAQIFNILFPFSLDRWHSILEILAISNMILGNSVVITQTSMKRMLAYSSISQIGYLMIEIIAGDHNGYARTFACIILFGLHTGTDNIRDYGGLFIKDPLLTVSFALCLLSLGGIPPLSGFFGKLYLFWCRWEAGLYLLVFVGLFTSIISVNYYLKIIKLLITKESEEMTAYIQTYVSSALPSLSKSSIEVGLIVCVIVSTSLGVLMNPINTIVQNTFISIHFISN
ncbi:hypothetical protein CY35_20G007900, partial [Sphagnum magellanicum]